VVLMEDRRKLIAMLNDLVKRVIEAKGRGMGLSIGASGASEVQGVAN